jgi:cytochrome c oxidase subunit 2
MSIQDVGMPASAQHVTVVGHQWWWEARYPDYGFVTANEIHIPAKSAPVMLKLESSDVIHSFWAPQLSGKTDLIPGLANTMWIDARQPGIYLGNCAEYCGTQHANMLIRVFAEPTEDFNRWVARQKPGAAVGDSPGRQKFESLACVSCHSVRGTAAHGVMGPDLTHLMSRTTIAAGMIVNNVNNLRQWILDPQAMKPGCLMPSMKLTDEEAGEILSYLQTLK